MTTINASTSVIDTQFSLTDVLKQRVSEKIKDAFVELVPDEMFRQMTELALDEFLNGPIHKRFKDVTRYDYDQGRSIVTGRVPIENNTYSPVQDPNTLPGMIYAEIKLQAQGSIEKVLAEPEWQGLWDPQTNGKKAVEGAMTKIITENAELFVQAMMNRIAAQAMTDALTSLRNRQY